MYQNIFQKARAINQATNTPPTASALKIGQKSWGMSEVAQVSQSAVIPRNAA